MSIPPSGKIILTQTIPPADKEMELLEFYPIKQEIFNRDIEEILPVDKEIDNSDATVLLTYDIENRVFNLGLADDEVVFNMIESSRAYSTDFTYFPPEDDEQFSITWPVVVRPYKEVLEKISESRPIVLALYFPINQSGAGNSVQLKAARSFCVRNCSQNCKQQRICVRYGCCRN